MIVKTVFMCDASIRGNLWLKLLKVGNSDVTQDGSYGMRRFRYQVAATT